MIKKYILLTLFVSFSFGSLVEENAFLGTDTQGAFNIGDAAETSYYGISYVKEFDKNLSFISKVDFGITQIDSEYYSVFKDFSDIRSRETSFALVKQIKKNKFGIAYTEPMRVESGNVLE